MENEDVWTVIKEMAPQVAVLTTAGAPVTLLWVVNKMRYSFEEEEIQEWNRRLIQIKKGSF